MSSGKEFFELVKAIGESKSKQEEDRIIAEEIIFLKKRIVETGIPKKKVKELLVRAIYVEMLGQDASYAYIRAVELCASTNIAQKRTGYLFGKYNIPITNIYCKSMNLTLYLLYMNYFILNCTDILYSNIMLFTNT